MSDSKLKMYLLNAMEDSIMCCAHTLGIFRQNVRLFMFRFLWLDRMTFS
jgi:hypothetical protein